MEDILIKQYMEDTASESKEKKAEKPSEGVSTKNRLFPYFWGI